MSHSAAIEVDKLLKRIFGKLKAAALEKIKAASRSHLVGNDVTDSLVEVFPKDLMGFANAEARKAMHKLANLSGVPPPEEPCADFARDELGGGQESAPMSPDERVPYTPHMVARETIATRIQLNFPLGLIHGHLASPSTAVAPSATIAVAAALEYAGAELLEIAGIQARKAPSEYGEGVRSACGLILLLAWFALFMSSKRSRQILHSRRLPTRAPRPLSSLPLHLLQTIRARGRLLLTSLP